MNSSVIIVTGAGGDLGRAIASAFCGENRTVIAADLDGAAAEATAEVLGQAGSEVVPVICDVTDQSSVAAMVKIARGLGDIGVLVNNAGGVTKASLQSMDLAGWQADVTLNLNAAYICFSAVENDLKAHKGCVVNIASINGMGAYGHPAYSAAKAGLIHFTKMIAVEYGKFGVRANAVAPGTVRTRAWDARAEANPGIFDEVRRWYPMERIARTEDVANAVKFLSSPEARAITGVCLPVDCGLSAGQTELARCFSQSEDY